MNKQYDVVIVGGGVIGLSLAAALSGQGIKLAIIDKQEKPMRLSLDDYDARVYAITRESENFLKQIGCWDIILKKRANPYRKMCVWDETGSGEIHFDSRDIAAPNIGHIIENKVLLMSLYDVLAKSDVDFYHQATLENIQTQDTHSRIFLSTTTLNTRLVVAADGANSWVRAQQNIALKSWDYQHHAIVCTVKTKQPHQATAWQRFLPCGPLAFLPLDDPHQCSIVWSTLPDKAKQLMALDDSAFCEALTKTFSRLGAITDVSQRYSFPLKMRHAREYTRSRLALIGDAAHTIHPLAGLGANLGFSDAKVLAEVILIAKKTSQDMGEHYVLRRYERARKGDNLSIILLMQAFVHLFSQTAAPITFLRNWGLSAVNQWHFIKRILMRQAMSQ